MLVTFINQDFFDKLPADLQQVVLDAAAKTTVDQRKIAVEVDGKAMQIMKDAGMTIETPSAEFTQQMIDATKQGTYFQKYGNGILSVGRSQWGHRLYHRIFRRDGKISELGKCTAKGK